MAEMMTGMKNNYIIFSEKLENKEYIKLVKNLLNSLDLSFQKITAKEREEPVENRCLEKTILLENLRKELGDCRRCELYKTRTNIVFGVGNPCSDIMFIGEAPGEEEDLKGEPFVGRAGRLLDNMLATIGLSRKENIYIANVLKSRPPENKISNHLESIPVCLPFLKRQIEIISPKIICCLGSIAAQAILETKQPISKIRGHFYDVNGIKVIPTYHPSFLLRNPIAKREAWEDLKKIKKMLNVLQEA